MPHEKPGVGMHTCNPRAWGDGDWGVPGAYWPAELLSPRFRERHCLKTKIESD